MVEIIKKVALNDMNKDLNINNNYTKHTIGNVSKKSFEHIILSSISVDLPYKNGIFGPEAIEGGYFGGNQGSLIYNFDTFIKNRKVWEIVQKYYPEADSEDLELLFYRMNRVGCGFIAAINTLLLNAGLYPGSYSFDQMFGYPFFGSNGYAYEYLFLDFFLYYAKEHMGYDTIEEVYGNAAEERKYNQNQDAALDDNEFKITGMDGTYVDIVSKVFQEFLKSKGINLKVYDGIPMSDEAKKEYIKEFEANGGIWIGDEEDIVYYPVEDAIDIVMKDANLSMVVSAKEFTLYYPYDKDGNGKLDDIAREDVGSHAMTVVGVTDDPNKIIVSSWGEEFVMDISEINDYAVYDYSGVNGVESSIP